MNQMLPMKMKQTSSPWKLQFDLSKIEHQNLEIVLVMCDQVYTSFCIYVELCLNCIRLCTSYSAIFGSLFNHEIV